MSENNEDYIREFLSKHELASAAMARFGQNAWEAAMAFSNRWIPVGEKMPEEAGSVLVNSSGDVVEAFFYTDGSWTTWNEHGAGELKNVTHWRPLPEPPK